MPQEITVNRIGRALHIRLDRADKRNAVTRSMYEAMTEAIAIAETDPAIRAVLFSGAGDGFCAGNDLNDFVGDPPTGMESPAFRFLYAISTAQKVLVAAAHGAAVGIGTTLLLHCDLVIAGRSARLSLPFVSLGLVPEAASTLLLPARSATCARPSCCFSVSRSMRKRRCAGGLSTASSMTRG
jgi:enoyl-CoA hydratase/carnithine racemase